MRMSEQRADGLSGGADARFGANSGACKLIDCEAND